MLKVEVFWHYNIFYLISKYLFAVLSIVKPLITTRWEMGDNHHGGKWKHLKITLWLRTINEDQLYNAGIALKIIVYTVMYWLAVLASLTRLDLTKSHEILSCEYLVTLKICDVWFIKLSALEVMNSWMIERKVKETTNNEPQCCFQTFNVRFNERFNLMLSTKN